MSATLRHFLDTFATREVPDELSSMEFELRCGPDGMIHSRWTWKCPNGGTKATETRSLNVEQLRKAQVCSTCARDARSLREGVVGDGELVSTWIELLRWLDKPRAAREDILLKRVRKAEETLRVSGWRRRNPRAGAWSGWMENQVRSELAKFAVRLGTAESALAAARTLMVAEAGGDESALDETMMLLEIQHVVMGVAEAEAIRRSCAVGSNGAYDTLYVPMWAAIYLMRRGASVRDMAVAENRELAVMAATFHESGSKGSHGLLAPALRSARACLA